jgi:Uma2 family endonuclease
LNARPGKWIGVEVNERYDEDMSTVATKPLKRVRWTVKEYFKISETGVFDDRRVELINGDVIEGCPQDHADRTAVSKTSRLLADQFDRRHYWVVIRGTLLLPPHSAPDPDFHVLDVPTGTPEQDLPLPFLVIEISDTTYLKDSGPKLRMYAKARIQDYWILNLPKDRLEVYRQPERISTTPARWRYGQTSSFGRSEKVSPLARPDMAFLVDDLLP